MRGKQLEFLNLYEFVAMIAIIPLPKDNNKMLEVTVDNNEGEEGEVERDE